MAITLVQTKTGNAGGYNNTNSQAFASNITAGNLIILAVTVGAADTIDSISDTRSNTYTLVTSDSSADRKTYVYYAANIAGGSCTVTVTFGSGQFPDSILMLREYSGLATSSPVDVFVSQDSGTSYVDTHPSGTSSATSQADELAFAVVGSSGSADPVFTVPSGYSNLASQDGFDDFTYSAIADKVLSATGTQSATFGSTGFVRSQTILVTFKAAGGASLTGSLSDTNTPTDSIAGVLDINRTLTDTNSPTDSITSALGINRTLTDSNTPTDNIVGALTINRTLSDTNTPTDNISFVISIAASLSDTNTPTDSISYIASYAPSLSDTNTPTDNIDWQASYLRTLSETNTPTDNISGALGISNALSETTAPTDTISGVITSAPVVSGEYIKKTYLYKFYNSTGTYLGSFYSNDFGVETIPNHTWKINGGKGNIALRYLAQIQEFVARSLGTNLPTVIQVWMHDKETPATGEIIYTGYLIDNNYTLNSNGFINPDGFLYISGEKDLANKVVENVMTGATTISYSSMDASNIIKDLLDKYALKGGVVTYTPSSIDTVGQTISITVKNESYLEAIKRIAGYLPIFWHFYIDGNNVFHLHRTDLDQVDHKIYIGNEGVAGSLRLSFGEITNTVFFHGGDTGGGTKLYKKYSNTVSQGVFGVYEKVLSDERVTDASTASIKANQILSKRGVPVRYLEATIIDSNGSEFGYNIDSIKPGDTISLMSSDIETQFTFWRDDTGAQGNGIWDVSPWDYSFAGILGVPLQVQEIKYNHSSATIIASDFIEDLATTVDQLEKKQVLNETVDSPTNPT